MLLRSSRTSTNIVRTCRASRMGRRGERIGVHEDPDSGFDPTGISSAAQHPRRFAISLHFERMRYLHQNVSGEGACLQETERMAVDMMCAFVGGQESQKIPSMRTRQPCHEGRIDQYDRIPEHIERGLAHQRVKWNLEDRDSAVRSHVLRMRSSIVDQAGHRHHCYAQCRISNVRTVFPHDRHFVSPITPFGHMPAEIRLIIPSCSLSS